VAEVSQGGRFCLLHGLVIRFILPPLSDSFIFLPRFHAVRAV